MKCPKCGLINPDTALRCDCGYDFASKEMRESYVAAAENAKAGSERKSILAIYIVAHTDQHQEQLSRGRVQVTLAARE